MERICRDTQLDQDHFALMVFDPDTLQPVDVSSLGSASDFAAASVSQLHSGKPEAAFGLELGCQTHTHQTHTPSTHTHGRKHTHLKKRGEQPTHTRTPVKMAQSSCHADPYYD
jgi:hypothetical protein